MVQIIEFGMKDAEVSSNIENEYIANGERKEYNSSISSESGESEAIEFCKAKGSQAWYTLAKRDILRSGRLLYNKRRIISGNALIKITLMLGENVYVCLRTHDQKSSMLS